MSMEKKQIVEKCVAGKATCAGNGKQSWSMRTGVQKEVAHA